MALPDSVLVVEATPIIWADATDWAAGGAESWGDDDYQLDLTDLSATEANAYRQSKKGDLGANRYPLYAVDLMVEMSADPTAGETIDLYVGYSRSGTDGTDNPGGLSGSDSAYSGYGGGTPANGVKNLEYVGSLVLDALNDLDDVQMGQVGIIQPFARYLSWVVYNNSSVALHSDAVNCAIRIRPLGVQVQD